MESALEFDDDGYQQLYPDVAEALRRGDVPSAFLHYRDWGRAEGRLFVGRIGQFTRVTFGADPGAPAGTEGAVPAHSIDAAFMSDDGSIFVVGWFDDTGGRLESLAVECRGWTFAIEADALARVARDDVRAVLGTQGRRNFGFWVLLCTGQSVPPVHEAEFVFTWQSGRETRSRNAIRPTDPGDLRDTVLSFLADAEQVGNPHPAVMDSLDRFVGEQILMLNRAVTRSIVSSKHVERFGNQGRTFKGSIIVCIYGKPEFMFLQNALFSGKPGIEDYEWIYVCNSPSSSNDCCERRGSAPSHTGSRSRSWR
ncbi:MAG: hypothetical protein M3Y41_07540 [Pseudomonadota bacterium]|nr:hypothetical protein [Pseudomonadota bacterium]